jgi:hypothetical protein
MRKHNEIWLAWSVCAAALLALAPPLWALDDDEALGFERTPPRLSFIDGEVSFWREGANGWTPARTNIALAPGDELWTAEGANLELQIDARTYVRAGEETQLGLSGLEPDYVQLRVTNGHVSIDVRGRKVAQTVEIATPNAAFAIEHTGYYRVEVDGETTSLISRRGGRATVTTATGEMSRIAASEQVVVTGTDAPQVETYAAPDLDGWDRWNYARTDAQLDAVSARYVSSGVYGVDDLDHYGDWRVVPTYGAVWVPSGVAVGWVPYSTGRWMYDPYYGWTWVDEAVWGWAPYHYGRWVHVSGFWGWAPGPIAVRPYYAPALVGFFGGGGVSFSLSFGPPHLGWVALGWGEPLIPWWGPVGCRGVPRWGGWRGPRIVNNVVVTNTTVINVREINIYQNAQVQSAIVAVDRKHFGRRPVAEARVAVGRAEKLAPIHDLEVKPDRRSFAAAAGDARRPPQEALRRPVVATRAARDARGSEAGRGAPARIVTPKRDARDVVSERPPFGTRSDTERRAPPPAPRYRDSERASPRGAERVPSPKAAEAPAGRDAPATRRQPAEPPGAADRPSPRVPSRDDARPTPDRVERPHGPGGVERGAEPQRGAGSQPDRVENRNAPGGVERGAGPQPDRVAVPPREPEVRARDLPGEPANRVFQPRPDRERGGGERAGGRSAPPGGDVRGPGDGQGKEKNSR